MPVHIKTLKGNITVEFNRGLFDEWCVYVSAPGKKKYAPKDAEYFGRLKELSHKHSPLKIYNDFLLIYNRTNHQINPAVLNLIGNIAKTYEGDMEEIDLQFTIIYAGMIAEENKAGAILKKRIKRLGMYQVLKEGMPADEASVFSKGKTWRELDVVMKEKGI